MVAVFNSALNKYVIASRITYNYLPFSKGSWYTGPSTFAPSSYILSTSEDNLLSDIGYTVNFDSIGAEGAYIKSVFDIVFANTTYNLNICGSYSITNETTMN